MKKLKSLITAVLLLTAGFLVTSCDELLGYLNDYVGDTFSGPKDEWLEMTVSYDDNAYLAGNINLAFFYTEMDRVGHSTNGTRLLKDYTIPAGLTVLCYGQLGLKGTGFTEKVYFIKTYPYEEGAKTEWDIIYNASAPLRKLEKTGTTVTAESGDTWITGENYGKWSVYHPEDGTALLDGQEKAPAPLTNGEHTQTGASLWLTNDQISEKNYQVNWDKALDKINVKLR